MSESHDAVVIGGGVMGCAAIHYLAKLGITDSVMLERDTIASGSTGRSMTILRMHYSNRIATEMAWWSRNVIANLDRHIGHPSGFIQNGWIMMPQHGNEDAARRNYSIAIESGVQTELLTASEASRKWHYIDFSSVEYIVWEPLSGYADSYSVTSGFAHSARQQGATIRTGINVIRFKTKGNCISAVETDHGDIRAKIFILTAGPWTSDLLDTISIKLPLSYVRHQVTRIIQPRRFSSVAEANHPTIAHVPSGLAARPDTPGNALIGYREDPVERDTYNRSANSRIAMEAMQALSSFIPAYADAGWHGGWAGIFTVTPDWNPVIDRAPSYCNLIIGAGFSGHGFKMAPAVGISLAELASEVQHPTFDLHPLRFKRYAENDLLTSSYGSTVFA